MDITTVQRSGRALWISIPRNVRDALQVTQGDRLEWRLYPHRATVRVLRAPSPEPAHSPPEIP